jgi:hypothetical protein
MPLNYNADKSIAPFTPAQIAAMNIRTLGVDDNSSPVWVRNRGNVTVRMSFLVDADQVDNAVCFFFSAGVRPTPIPRLASLLSPG